MAFDLRPAVCLLVLFIGAEAAGRADVVRAKHKPGNAWSEHPVQLIGQLPGFTPATEPPALDEYGGWPGLKFDATGFFHTHLAGDRWWIVDPDGNAFLSEGVASVAPGRGPASRAAFDSKFGGDAAWAGATTKLLHDAGFNSSGAWSDDAALRAAPHPLAYTPILDLMSRFGQARHLTSRGTGHMAYASNAIPVFDPSFPDFCAKEAKGKVHPDDPWLLGYFSDNELPLPRLENYLQLNPDDPAQAPNLQAARDWVAAHHLDPAHLAKADDDAWIGHVMDLYARITTTAIRQADPHHLCLGERLYGPSFRSPGTWAAEGKYCDIICINYYSGWTTTRQDYAHWLAWSGKPFIVTEFYVKGDDAGFPNQGGAGWIVPTQADRGLFYENFVLSLLASKTCVGWHWFKYMDNDPSDLKTDPSNRDSNKGVVSLRYEPYAPLVSRMKETNLNTCQLIPYLDRQK